MKAGHRCAVAGDRAHAPLNGRAVTQMDVTLAVWSGAEDASFGSLREPRLQGAWAAARRSPQKPASFQTMPLVWERAFGGADRTGARNRRRCRRTRQSRGDRLPGENTAGRLAKNLQLPNLENPTQVLRLQQGTARSRPASAPYVRTGNRGGVVLRVPTDEELAKQPLAVSAHGFRCPVFSTRPCRPAGTWLSARGEAVEISAATPSERCAVHCRKTACADHLPTGRRRPSFVRSCWTRFSWNRTKDLTASRLAGGPAVRQESVEGSGSRSVPAWKGLS